MTKTSPVISIITVVLNNSGGFRLTAGSVMAQRYPGIEFIVIDGGSTDGTLQHIREISGRIHYWVSEPDNGIYDAMNKGIEQATGEWIVFLNAGDVFAGPDVLSRIFARDFSGTDVIYGDSIADYSQFMALRRAGSPEHLWKGMPFSHQALFVRSSLVKTHQFSTEFTIAADFDQVYRLYKDNSRFLHFPEPVCIVEVEGVSNQRYLRSWKERYTIYKKSGDATAIRTLFYGAVLITFIATMAAYRLLSSSLLMRILKYRYRKEICK
ncbi:MAG: glycosyltransferase family 2 protein [Bacteroidales bacterium]